MYDYELVFLSFGIANGPGKVPGLPDGDDRELWKREVNWLASCHLFIHRANIRAANGPRPDK
jgi:hypothetical protein